MRNTSPRQTNPRGRWTGAQLACLVLSLPEPGLATLRAETEVAPGSNLTPTLNNATATDHTFKLLGDVYMGSAFSMNGTDRKTIHIDGAYGDGQRAVIERRDDNYRFNVTTDGNTLAIRNAIITGTDTSGGDGAIYIAADNATLDLHNTLFTGNTATTHRGAAISNYRRADATIHGDITFRANTSSGDASGAVGVYGNTSGNHSDLTFTGATTFEQNMTTRRGGALAVYEQATATFEGKAIFRGNYATTYYGGAIDLWGGNARATFKNDVEFTGNYVKNTNTHTYGVRGGAINIGYATGTATPQLELLGDTTTFTDNYVWGNSTTKAYGGALAIMSGRRNPDTGTPPASREYAIHIKQGQFDNNLAYSDTGNAYGGAIYAKTRNNTLTLGTGTRFTNNHAKTHGGAIYFDQGTLNLNGNTHFEGNTHAASFATTDGKLTPIPGTGTPNAIYFGVSSNTATLNLNTTAAADHAEFHDPITAATGKTVTINKTGAGEVTFYKHTSDLLAQTTVHDGTFRLADGATFGLKGTPTTSHFTLEAGATLRGGADSTLRTTLLKINNGNLHADTGTLHLDATTAQLTFDATSTLTFTIEDTNTFGQIAFTHPPAHLSLNGATLEIDAPGYVPSLDISDIFTLITGLTHLTTGQFAQADHITINGADFAIDYNPGDISLRQLTAANVPEPVTCITLLGLILAVITLLRRRQ
jgi:predicted outer membrane repeat protein